MLGKSSEMVVLFVLVGFAVSLLLIPLIRRHFRPTSRRQLHQTHTQPVSRFGGLALVLPFALAAGAWLWLSPESLERRESWVVLVSALGMFLVGFWDDCQPLGARKKLVWQILIASYVYFCGIHIDTFRNPVTQSAHDLGAWGYVATVLWLVALTNLINLIDGMDGLAGGISLMVMALLLFVGMESPPGFAVLCTAAVCGALIGFLCYNFPPASIYLGDGGAYLLGFLAGIFSMLHSEKGTVAAALIAPLFVLALPIIDVSLAILRRGLKGMPLFRPDRRHLHHKLAQCGLSRTRIVLLSYGISLVFLVLALAIFLLNGKWLPLVFGLGCIVLLICAGSFSFSRQWFSVGKVLGNSHVVRKQTRHALALQRWLELEVDRISAPEQLWDDFAFFCGKLGFAKVTLNGPDTRRVWQSPNETVRNESSYQTEFELPTGQRLEVIAPESLGLDGFELLSELTAETWLKLSERWQALHGVSLELNGLAKLAAADLPASDLKSRALRMTRTQKLPAAERLCPGETA